LLQHHRNGITFLQFDIFSRYSNLVHGVFTRGGGVSPPPYDSLNLALVPGDRRENVVRNQDRVREALGLERLIWGRQVHGLKIRLVDGGPRPGPGDFESDGLITRQDGLGLLVKLADCQGVILFDPDGPAVGIVHCGWRGNVQNVLGRAVEAMIRTLGCDPARLRAGIGPSLGPCCAQFINFDEEFGPDFDAYRVGRDRVDLWRLSTDQLVAAGLSPENIEVMGLCTRCRTDLFFSYRAEKGPTGRFGAVAALRAS
jgi:YfiH family protein